ncbi:MAG: 2-dehydropantoate 2-reductase [Betaproteobacteria bacterium]|nr:2-dehydropantoate 2-reductase [Betaproteobacteria bacterium]
MDRKIAVVGAGAIGSCVAASMTRAGCDVSIVDQWPQHIDAMKANGVRIITKEEDYTVPVQAYHLCELATFNPEFDIAFITVKSYDTQWMAKYIANYLKADGVLVCLQNGFNDDANAEMVGRKRIIGCVVELSCEIFTPGRVQRNTVPSGTWFSVGELDGSTTPRLLEAQALLKHVGKCDTTGNIYGAKWTKLIANSMTCPFSSLGLKNWEAVKLPGMFEFSVEVGKESFAVGQALGYRIEPLFGLTGEQISKDSNEAITTVMRQMIHDVGPNARTHAAQDHAKGRRSEIEYINGRVVLEGARLGIPTPYNHAVCEVARKTHRGEIKLDPANLALLQAEVKKAA